MIKEKKKTFREREAAELLSKLNTEQPSSPRTRAYKERRRRRLVVPLSFSQFLLLQVKAPG
jgi:hypothetical protein